MEINKKKKRRTDIISLSIHTDTHTHSEPSSHHNRLGTPLFPSSSYTQTYSQRMYNVELLHLLLAARRLCCRGGRETDKILMLIIHLSEKENVLQCQDIFWKK